MRLPVEQFWRNNSAEIRYNSETKSTDAAGRLTFPERSLRSTNIARLLIPVPLLLSGGIHANFGNSTNIALLCDTLVIKQQPLEYDGSALPSKLVVIFQPPFTAMPGHQPPSPICAALVEHVRDVGA